MIEMIKIVAYVCAVVAGLLAGCGGVTTQSLLVADTGVREVASPEIDAAAPEKVDVAPGGVDALGAEAHHEVDTVGADPDGGDGVDVVPEAGATSLAGDWTMSISGECHGPLTITDGTEPGAFTATYGCYFDAGWHVWGGITGHFDGAAVAFTMSHDRGEGAPPDGEYSGAGTYDGTHVVTGTLVAGGTSHMFHFAH